MMNSDTHTDSRSAGEPVTPLRAYEPPTVADLGSLDELTLSGNGPLSDGFGSSSSGGS